MVNKKVAQKYALSDYLTFIDDSSSKRAYKKIRQAMPARTHLVDSLDYELLKYFSVPRNKQSFSRYFNQLKKRIPESKFEGDVNLYFNRFLEHGLLRKVKEKFKWKRDTGVIFVEGGMQEEKGSRTAHVAPSSVAICPTNGCNLRCKHCSQHEGNVFNKQPAISLNEIKDIFNQIDDLGVRNVRITGGEPTIHRNFEEIFKYAADCRFGLYLFTNGYGLTEKKLELIGDVCRQKKGDFLVHLSMDGGTARTHDWFRGKKGSFVGMKAAAKKLSQMNVPFYYEMIVNRKNMNNLEAAIKTAISVGAGSISIHTAACVGNAISNYDVMFLSIAEMRELKKQINSLREKYKGKLGIRFNSYTWPMIAVGKRYMTKNKYDKRCFPDNGFSETNNNLDRRRQRRCNAGSGQLTIGADLKVYPCPNGYGSEMFQAGDLRKNTLREIWEDGNWGVFRSGWTIDELGFCRECKWVETYCQNGYTCRTAGQAGLGDIMGPPVACIMSFKELGIGKKKTLAYLNSRLEKSDSSFYPTIHQLIDYVKDR